MSKWSKVEELAVPSEHPHTSDYASWLLHLGLFHLWVKPSKWGMKRGYVELESWWKLTQQVLFFCGGGEGPNSKPSSMMGATVRGGAENRQRPQTKDKH